MAPAGIEPASTGPARATGAPDGGRRWVPPATRERPPLPDGPYLVVGLGLAGQAAAAALAERAGPAALRAWDADEAALERPGARRLRERGVELHAGGDPAELLRGERPPRCVVKSPGVPSTAPPLGDARARGIEVIDEAELGWRIDRRPVVGVTGTNGKSTVAALACAVLRAAGTAPLLAGNSSFGPPLSAAAGREGDVVVAEVSSFQLQSSPTLLPDAAVLTNIGDDHWQRHGGRAGYVADKLRLFERGERCAPVAAVNVDDAVGRELARRLARRGARVVGFGRSPDAGCRVGRCDWTLAEGSVELELDGRALSLRTRLPGPHNALNLAAALALASALRIDAERAAAALERCAPVPGRFELVGARGGVELIVDYAHNPDGLRGALGAARRVVERRGGRLIVVASVLAPVVDERQRAAMGRALAELADTTVVTLERIADEEPRDRPPAGLLEGIRAGGGEAEVVPDRRAAIERALALARRGDVVMTVNRGTRTEFLDVAGRRGELDDRAAGRAALGARR